MSSVLAGSGKLWWTCFPFPSQIGHSSAAESQTVTTRSKSTPRNSSASFERHELAGAEEQGFLFHSAVSALVRKVVISAGEGIRPEETTFSLMTSPGVDMML